MSAPGSNVPMPPGDVSREDLLARMLYEEQTRLRAELDELRKAQQQEDKQGEPKKDANGGGEKEDEKGSGKEGDGSDEKQKENKPPTVQRLRAWTGRHPKGTMFIVVGFVALVIAAMLQWRYIESYEDTDDAFIEGHVDPISARISGRVVGAYVENTYHVKKGEVLVELDPRDYEVALEQARADLAEARAGERAQTPNVPITRTSQSTEAATAELSAESAQASLEAAEQRYRSALSDLAEAQANAANAARDEQRYRLLVAKEEVSRELYDQRATESKAEEAMAASRQQTADAAAKDVAAARSALNQARQRAAEAQHNLSRQIVVQQQTLAMRHAGAQQSQAKVDQALLNLQYTKIYAPADGIVGDRTVQLGTEVTPGEEMLALTESNDIWVTANFKETQIRRMRTGESVSIHVDALGTTFQGYVEALAGASGAEYSLLPPENATGNYVKVVQRIPVRIRFKQGQKGLDRLAPGMSVEPKVWLR